MERLDARVAPFIQHKVNDLLVHHEIMIILTIGEEKEKRCRCNVDVKRCPGETKYGV